METEDLDEVCDMEASCSITPWSKNMFIEEMKNPFAHCFVIKMKGRLNAQVVGFICFQNIGDESELLNICVHQQYRQMGIGRKLMQFYIRFSKKTKTKTFYLEVNASNQPAVRLYELFSYESLGMRKKFYRGELDALLMVKKD